MRSRLSGEQSVYHGNKIVERPRLKLRIKGYLVPPSTKIDTGLIVRMANKFVTGMSILIVVMHPVVTLKQTVIQNYPVVLLTDIGSQERGGNLRMISRRNYITYIMQ